MTTTYIQQNIMILIFVVSDKINLCCVRLIVTCIPLVSQYLAPILSLVTPKGPINDAIMKAKIIEGISKQMTGRDWSNGTTLERIAWRSLIGHEPIA